MPDHAIPAATLIVMRPAAAGGADEILFAVRARTLAFAGGMAVFPGGRVDPGDRVLARQLASPQSDGLPDALDLEMAMDEAAHRIAAIRETLEEAGLALALDPPPSTAITATMRDECAAGAGFADALARRGMTVRLDALVPFARWLPDLDHARVFDARFYLVRYDGDHGATPDGTETARLFWATADAALELAARGTIGLIYPTRRNLERLAACRTFAAAARHAGAHPVRTITPRIEDRDGVRWLTIPADAGYPVTGEPFDAAARG